MTVDRARIRQLEHELGFTHADPRDDKECTTCITQRSYDQLANFQADRLFDRISRASSVSGTS